MQYTCAARSSPDGQHRSSKRHPPFTPQRRCSARLLVTGNQNIHPNLTRTIYTTDYRSMLLLYGVLRLFQKNPADLGIFPPPLVLTPVLAFPPVWPPANSSSFAYRGFASCLAVRVNVISSVTSLKMRNVRSTEYGYSVGVSCELDLTTRGSDYRR